VSEVYKLQGKVFYWLLADSEGAGSLVGSQKAFNRWCRKFKRCRKKSRVDYPSHSEGAGNLKGAGKGLMLATHIFLRVQEVY